MASSTHNPTSFRPDIDGLRAVAVLIVVAFHAGIPGFGAGFIGVDLFLVISGFLITQKLRSEIEQTGRLDYVGFILGRVRRLLPAAFVVIGVTLLLSLVVFVPFLWPDLVTDAWASTFYWANLRFGSQYAGYFARGVSASPFQHMWSLSVEEQFYVVWPLVMAGTAKRSRSVALAVVGTITVGCFVFAVLDAVVPTSMTYYNPLSRGWELGAGATLALAWPWVEPRVLGRWVPLLLRGSGAVLLAVAAVVVPSAGGFPGLVSALPVSSAMLLIAAHADKSPLASLLGSRPAQHIGRWSYSWYLWHWPVMVLGARALTRWADVSYTWRVGVLLGVVSLVPAYLSYRFVETPFRRSPVLVRSRVRTAGFAAASACLSVLMIGGAHLWTQSTLSEPELLAFADARVDWPEMTPACATNEVGQLLENCTTGQQGGEHTLIFGDSHAANWVAGLRPAVEATGGRLTTAIGGSCLLLGDGARGEQSWCAPMREGMLDTIDALEPDRVVFSQESGYDLLPGGNSAERNGELWEAEIAEFLEAMSARDIEAVVILSTPRHGRHPIDCRTTERDPSVCGMDRIEAEASVAVFSDAARRAHARVGHGILIDPVDLLCNADSCPFEDRDMIVWVDGHHLTTAYAATFEPFFVDVLEEAMLER